MDDFKKIIANNRQIIGINAVVSLIIALSVASVWGGVGLGGGAGPAGQAVNSRQYYGNASASNKEGVVQIVQDVDPAVVSIVITKDVPILERYYSGGDFFRNFGLQLPQYRQKGTEKKEVGGGSGFLVSAGGLVVTNRHVVDDPEASYTVFTNDNKKHEAKVVARDETLDLAVLQIAGTNYPYLEFGDSSTLKPGQTVIAIGNALGEFRNSVSVGVVSGLSRSIVAGDRMGGGSERLEDVIQTDAAINPGNSGGPLLDLAGKVVGVNVAMASGSENIAFALPANLVKEAVKSVEQHGEIVRPFIGIRYQIVTASLQEKNDLPYDYGVLVARGETPEDLAVIPGSPADKAGIVENDIILEIDGVKLTSETSLAQIIRQKTVGQTVVLKVWHRGSVDNVSVTLAKAKQ